MGEEALGQSEETQVDEEHEITEEGHDAPVIDDASIGAMFDDDTETHPDGETAQDEKTSDETKSDQQAEPLEAPQHWAEADKEVFNTLPRESQDFLLRRHKEMEGDYTRGKQSLAEEARAIEGLKPLGEALKRDPALREYLKNYNQSDTKETGTDETDANG